MIGFNNTSGSWLGLHAHFIFVLILLVSIILFLIWSYKSLNKTQLGKWTLTLCVIGILGVLLTSNLGGQAWQSMHGNWNNQGLNQMMMHLDDEDHRDIDTPEEFREHMLEEMKEHMGLDK